MSEEDQKPKPPLISLVSENDLTGVKRMLQKGEGRPQETDGSGMTPLHHAAYKGNAQLCKVLIEHGADVNSDSHDHRYSALHFAALSGSTETVQYLLNCGAKTYHTNTLGRTATQMAAFVGNHAVVALINNYVPESKVQMYTEPMGLEEKPKLSKSAQRPLYDLIMQVNLHPVGIALTVGKSNELCEDITGAWRVLELMCEKESKQPENVNEVLCLKFHYLAYVLKTLEKELKKQAENKETKEKETSGTDTSRFESIIRKWLRGRQSDGFEEHLEYYIRDAVKSFPHVEMPLFMQLIRNITGGSLGDTWALSILSGCINGQRAFQDEKACSTCGQESKDAKKCSKCKMIQYCNRVCQRLHWPIHKKFCDKLVIKYEKEQKLLEEKKKTEETKSSNDEVLASQAKDLAVA